MRPVAILVLGSLGLGVVASQGSPLPPSSAPLSSPHHDLQRHSVQFETATVTLLSPGSFTKRPYTMSLEERSRLRNSETWIYDQRPEIQVVVGWIRNREGFRADPEGGVQGVLMADQQSEGVERLGSETWKTTVSGLSAVRASARYRAFGTETVFTGKNSETWFAHVYASPTNMDIARRIVESLDVRGPGTEGPDQPAAEHEFLTLGVTSEGDIYLDGEQASLESVRKELERLREGHGVVLYYRAGGSSPTPETERTSSAILFELGRLDLPFVWSEEARPK